MLACHGPGPYGFARAYEPLLSERPHLDQAQQLPYEQVNREPYNYRGTEIAWFGVVTEMNELPDGRTEARLSFRLHQGRHLCSDEYQDSCRVTVSDNSSGQFTARMKVPASEKSGQERLWLGSLLKIYGKPTGDYDQHGDPVIETTYYRHWPRGYYVTTAQRAAMRR